MNASEGKTTESIRQPPRSTPDVLPPLQCNDATHTVSNKNRSFHAEFLRKATPGHLRIRVPYIAAVVHRWRRVRKDRQLSPCEPAEVLDLWREKIVIAGPSMHE